MYDRHTSVGRDRQNLASEGQCEHVALACQRAVAPMRKAMPNHIKKLFRTNAKSMKIDAKSMPNHENQAMG